MNDTLDLEDITLYAVRNKEGKFFRSKGYGGYGDTWVDGVKKARIYNRIGPARTQVSYFANTYPEYGIPEIVQFVVGGIRVLDETERVEKQRKKKEDYKARQEAYVAQRQLEDAQQRLAQAQREIESLKRKR